MTKFTPQQVQRQVAAEILVVADFVNGTPEEKIKWGKRIVGALLKTKGSNLDKLKDSTRHFAIREAVGLLDVNTNLQRTYPSTSKDTVQKSYTKTTAAPNARDIPLPKPSEYQTKAEMIKALVNQGLSLAAAIAEAEKVFGQSQTERGSNKKSASLSPIYTHNPYHKDWNEKIEEEADRRIRQAKNDLGLPQQDTPAWQITQDFLKGIHVPKSESNDNIKSGSIIKNNPLNAHFLNAWQMNKSFRNSILLNKEQNQKKIHSANVSNDGTPIFLKLQKHTLSTLGNFA